MRIIDLKQFVDRTVTLRMKDGETAKVKLNFIDEEYEDIIAAVVEGSRPSATALLALCRTVGVDPTAALSARCRRGAELLQALEEWRPVRVEKWLDRETR